MRENRKHVKKTSKGIWYLTGTAIGLAIITFIVAFTAYKSKMQEQVQESKLDSQKISQIVQDIDKTESISTDIGKTVEEVKSSNEYNNVDIVTNEAINENNTTVENTVKKNTNTNSTTKKSTETEKTVTTSSEEKKEISFIKPVDGDILKSFAKDNLLYSETLGEWTTHLGIDIKADKTTIVKASEEGKVKSIKNDPRYGLSVIIEHANGYETLYSNLLSTEFVQIGEEVKQGQSIGTVGNTATFEIADASHLHFEILKDGVQQDPNLILK